jgi:hypothetical protein
LFVCFGSTQVWTQDPAPARHMLYHLSHTPSSWQQNPEEIFAPFSHCTIICHRQKQPACPLMDEKIKKMQYMHTREFYLALQRKKVLTHLLWGEISQPQQDKYCTSSLTWGIWDSEAHRAESGMWLPEAGEGTNWESVSGCSFSYARGKVLEICYTNE